MEGAGGGRERERVTWAGDEQNEIIREQDRQKNRIEIKGKVEGGTSKEGRAKLGKTNERMKRRWPRTSEMSYPSVSTVVVCLLEGNRFPALLPLAALAVAPTLATPANHHCTTRPLSPPFDNLCHSLWIELLRKTGEQLAVNINNNKI